MAVPHITHLYRYPIKGFPPQALAEVQLDTHAGIPFDRRFAITNGQLDVAPNGAWTACQAFVRLTKNSSLPLFEIHFHEADKTVSIQHPGGEWLSVALHDRCSIAAANKVLKTWFATPESSPPQLVQSTNQTGYWDHEDAAISIINAESVAQLAEAAGQAIDPLRFRGNLLLAGLPAWEELKWPGQRVQVGEAVLEVLRPIDRCIATSVHPDTGVVDINLPALLARHTGHVFCGVYARVVRPGKVRAGDAITVIGHSRGALARASQARTAPPAASWPRAGQIIEVIQESADVRSFWITDPLGAEGAAPDFRAGQHLRLHGLGADGRGWRSYTISGVRSDGSLRISVKREEHGVCSPWLHTYGRPGTRVLFSGPFGEFQLQAQFPDHVTLLSAGIGITPMVALLSSLSSTRPATFVRLVHVARNAEKLALWPDVMKASSTLPNAQIELYLSQGGEPDVLQADHPPCIQRRGRPDLQVLAQEFAALATQVFICGPAAFTQQAVASLMSAGVPARCIHHEVFVSPASRTPSSARPKRPGPFKVHFAISNLQTVWREHDGTLLDLAERHGLSLPANCRSGACMACKQTLNSGEVTTIMEPLVATAHHSLLMCCSVPASDISIAA